MSAIRKRFELIGILLLTLGLGCYENEEGCQDIFASNFDVEADLPCTDDCCNYPSLSLSIQHRQDTLSFSASRKLYNGLGDSFQIIRAGLLMSQLSLQQTDGVLRIREQREFATSSGASLSLPDDFAGVTNSASSYNLGTHLGHGEVSSISLALGLSTENAEIQPDGLPDSHILAEQGGFRYEGAYIGGYIDVLYDTMTMDTIRYRLPAQLALDFSADTTFTIDYGDNLSIPLQIDYLQWVAGINFVEIGSDEAAVIQAVVNNLPNAISLAD